MRVTVKKHILSYLQYRGWVSGSELETSAAEWATKPSVVTRRARELANDGLIERGLTARRTVEYRLPVKAQAIGWLDD